MLPPNFPNHQNQHVTDWISLCNLYIISSHTISFHTFIQYAHQPKHAVRIQPRQMAAAYSVIEKRKRATVSPPFD